MVNRVFIKRFIHGFIKGMVTTGPPLDPSKLIILITSGTLWAGWGGSLGGFLGALFVVVGATACVGGLARGLLEGLVCRDRNR